MQRQTNGHFAQYPLPLVDMTKSTVEVVTEACNYLVDKGYAAKGKKLLVVSGTSRTCADDACRVQVRTARNPQTGGCCH